MVGLVARWQARKAEQIRIRHAEQDAYNATIKVHRDREVAEREAIREAERGERRLEREHQVNLLTQITAALEVITDGSAKQAEENTKAISELAKSSAKQAEAFSEWMKCFQTGGAAPTSSVVRDEDEIAEEEERALAEMPEEFRLAYNLHQQDFMSDVKKDLRP